MERAEVIENLRIHLKNARLDKRKVDRKWCIHYLMDFLLVKKEEAIKIFETEVI